MRRWRAAAAVAAACALAAAGASLSAPVPLQPKVGPLQHGSARLTYPVYDPAGRKVRSQSWFVTDAGGNCCEVQVSSTPTGRLLEFGGQTLNYSDDRGRTWTKVETIDPRLNGEGAVLWAPGGDVVGVSWDAYSGDRLHAFKYDGSSKTWSYAESPVHTPFFDRPWIAVLKGPVDWMGAKVPYLTLVISGYSGTVLFASGDGLTYVPTSRGVDEAAGSEPLTQWLGPVADADLDYLQPHPDSNLTPIAGGLVSLGPDPTSACESGLLGRNGKWSCLRLPTGSLGGRLVADSRGWLHQAIRTEDQTRMVYRVSTDGGRTWHGTVITPPGGGVIEPMFDVKAHGGRRMAAVAARVQHADARETDFVFRLSVTSRTPRHVETYQVGAGDLVAGDSIIATSNRYDFSSVAIMPDGRIAASFLDKAHPTPALAVLT